MQFERNRASRSVRIGALLVALATAGLTAGCDAARVADQEGREISLVAPSDQTIERGGTTDVVVAISRSGIEGPITIRVEELPAGVAAVEKEFLIPADKSSQPIRLRADADAALVDDAVVKVVAGGPDAMSLADHFRIDVVAAR
jgi:hypothetical protein